jgi:hypothetical protein
MRDYPLIAFDDFKKHLGYPEALHSFLLTVWFLDPVSRMGFESSNTLPELYEMFATNQLGAPELLKAKLSKHHHTIAAALQCVKADIDFYETSEGDMIWKLWGELTEQRRDRLADLPVFDRLTREEKRDMRLSPFKAMNTLQLKSGYFIVLRDGHYNIENLERLARLLRERALGGLAGVVETCIEKRTSAVINNNNNNLQPPSRPPPPPPSRPPPPPPPLSRPPPSSSVSFAPEPIPSKMPGLYEEWYDSYGLRREKSNYEHDLLHVLAPAALSAPVVFSKDVQMFPDVTAFRDCIRETESRLDFLVLAAPLDLVWRRSYSDQDRIHDLYNSLFDHSIVHRHRLFSVLRRYFHPAALAMVDVCYGCAPGCNHIYTPSAHEQLIWDVYQLLSPDVLKSLVSIPALRLGDADKEACVNSRSRMLDQLQIMHYLPTSSDIHGAKAGELAQLIDSVGDSKLADLEKLLRLFCKAS